MAETNAYNLDDVEAIAIPADEIDSTFHGCVDLVSSRLSTRILSYSDEFFASSSNLNKPSVPISRPGHYIATGAWYDGWETRRHNPAPFDYVIFRLGISSGTVEGVEIDTAFFNGNHAPEASVEGTWSEDDEEVKSWGGGRGKWETVLGKKECQGSTRHGWKLVGGKDGKAYTHVRINMYPDGGIARFRLFGHAVPIFPSDPEAIFDLAAVEIGGVAVNCSNDRFGRVANLLLPGRGKDMGDGWETARSRGDHLDWAIVRLGARGKIEKLMVDTAFFRGNFPKMVQVEGLNWKGEGEPGYEAEGWTQLVGKVETGPDKVHDFDSEVKGKVFSHVKLVVIPDGGVKRLRVMGKRTG